MARGVPPPDQVHIDLGALDERVRGTERAIDDVNGRLDNLGTQLNNLSSSISSQMTRLSEKIDAKMQVKPTNWVGFVSSAAAVVAVLLTIGGAVMVPVFGDLGKLSDDIKQVQRDSATDKDLDAVDRTMHSRDDKLSQLIETLERDKIGAREHEEFRSHIEERITSLEKTQDSRFLDFDRTVADRFTQIVSRLDAISVRLNEGQDRPK